MEDFLAITAIISSVVLILLAINNWAIQPFLAAKDYTSAPINRDWSTATKKALDNLKNYRSNYKNEHFTVESFDPNRGQAELTVEVTPRWSLLFSISGISDILNLLGKFPEVIARHRLKIDRSGDILTFQTLPVRVGEKKKFPISDNKNQNSNLIITFGSIIGFVIGIIWFFKERTYEPLSSIILSSSTFIASLNIKKILDS